LISTLKVLRAATEVKLPLKQPSWQALSFCSVGTSEDVDLELLVDDFITFYIAGEQNVYSGTSHNGPSHEQTTSLL